MTNYTLMVTMLIENTNDLGHHISVLEKIYCR